MPGLHLHRREEGVMSILKRFHLFHDWQKWSEPTEGNLNYIWGSRIKGMFQTRLCETCGKVKIRRIDR